MEAALGRKEQVNRHKKVDGRVEAHIIAIACSEAPEGRERWTLQLIADELVRLGIVEDFTLSEVNVLEGDITPLSDPSQNAIAAVYSADEYGVIHENDNCFKVGDTVTLRYVEEWTNVDMDTGEEVSADEADARWARGETNYVRRAKVYEEKEYTVCARIEIPSAFTYRYFTLGASQLAMGAELFKQDTGMSSVMIYAFNTTGESNAAMEDFLKEYTESVQPTCDYESKQSKIAEFEGFRNMFLTMGGTLAGIIGLVGVLNFICKTGRTSARFF